MSVTFIAMSSVYDKNILEIYHTTDPYFCRSTRDDIQQSLEMRAIRRDEKYLQFLWIMIWNIHIFLQMVTSICPSAILKYHILSDIFLLFDLLFKQFQELLKEFLQCQIF